MANATRRGTVGTVPFADYGTPRAVVNTAQTFYINSMVGLLASGYLDKMDDAAAKRFDGVIISVSLEVPSGGSNGDYTVIVNQPRHIRVAIAAAVIGDIGRPVYATDDQTVTFTPGAFANLVGLVSAVISATCVEVECVYLGKGTGTGTGASFTASADGAIPIKSGTVAITKGSAAALTLAAPVSGTDDGKTLDIISTTAFAHTVTQTTPGFNGGGTASDVGTFAAAVGNYLTVRAYAGVWYVVGNVGVTLA